MIKKISVIVFLILLFINTNTYAGDIPESIMTGNQQALFIGKITDINTDSTIICISNVMMGEIEELNIKVKNFESYYGTANKPKVGDFIVGILLDKNTIDNTWVFKATSDDYKTLKLVSEQYDMVLRYEKYINKGNYFDEQKKLDTSNNTAISPTDTSIENKEIVEDTKAIIYLNNNKFIIVLFLIIFVPLFLFIVNLKNKFNNQS